MTPPHPGDRFAASGIGRDGHGGCAVRFAGSRTLLCCIFTQWSGLPGGARRALRRWRGNHHGIRLTDAFLCFPQLSVLIVLGALIRSAELRVLQGSIVPNALVIGVLSWMGLPRLVRATFLDRKEGVRRGGAPPGEEKDCSR